MQHNLTITVAEFVDDGCPGFVRCTFTDAHNTVHSFPVKVPYVTSECLTRDSAYPRAGELLCDEVSRRKLGGRTLVTISFDEVGPASIDEGARFEVRLESLSPVPPHRNSNGGHP